MFAKYLFVISLFSGGWVLHCVAQDVPFPYPGHPDPAVEPHKTEQHQDPIGPLDKTDLPSGDHAKLASKPHSHNLHHTDFFHHVPPPPESSANNYIATVSYGEGYPSVIYHCSLTDHKPTTPFVYGPNGHICTVSFLKDPGHFHTHDDERVHEHHKDPLTELLDKIWPQHQQG